LARLRVRCRAERRRFVRIELPAHALRVQPRRRAWAARGRGRVVTGTAFTATQPALPDLGSARSVDCGDAGGVRVVGRARLRFEDYFLVASAESRAKRSKSFSDTTSTAGVFSISRTVKVVA